MGSASTLVQWLKNSVVIKEPLINSNTPYHASVITELPLIHQGKVRDSFAIDERLMMIVASDRLSAFDVVLPDPIPGKGKVLTRLSNFWFDLTGHIVPNHLSHIEPESVLQNVGQQKCVQDRAVVVKRLKPLPIEAIVRGYLIGSGWSEYQATSSVSGLSLPAGLKQADRLPEVLFTPSSKAAAGEHDVNISFQDTCDLIGPSLADKVRQVSISLYQFAAEHALKRGIIIADTKFEFGLDQAGEVLLMDEVLTSDSSRFWPVESYQPGSSPPSFDKQYVRDYLETLDWNKTSPGPELPADIIRATSKNYEEALVRLTT